MRRRAFLGGSLTVLAAALASRRARASVDRQLLVYWVSGGWDPTFVFDPHLDSDVIVSDDTATLADIGGLPIVDASTRPAVRTFFEAWAPRTVLFNGLAVGSISHDACTRLMLTGQRSGLDPDVATRIAAATGSDRILPHVVLGGPRFSGSHGALVSLVSPTFVAVAGGTVPGVRDAALEERVRAWLAEEVAAGSVPDATFSDGLARLPDLEKFAAEFEAHDLSQEAGRMAVAARLLASGASRSVLIQGSAANLAQWDSHQMNGLNQAASFEHLFGNLSTLMALLAATDGPSGGKLSESTDLLVLSEMGRQPTLNGDQGKDHWPITSAMLVSPACSGGRVVGGTDGTLAPLAVDLASGELAAAGEVLTAGNLIATMVAGYDLDPGEWADGETPIGGVWG